MNSMKKLCFTALLASTLPVSAAFAADTIKAEEFVEEASAKGLAEIETSKAALKESQNPEVRDFAQTMIDDHTKANEELAKIARAKKLELSDDPELTNQVKAMVLKMRDGKSFNQAYANNQVMAHKNTIELFQKASTMQDAELKAFAQKTLPKLEQHLKMAQSLQQATGAKKDDDSMNDHSMGDHSKNHDGDNMHNMNNDKKPHTGMGTSTPTPRTTNP